MNKTVVIIAFIGVVVIGFVGVVLIALLRPDAVGSIITFVGVLLSTSLMAIVTISALSTITKNTNGRLTQLTEHNEALITQVAEQGLVPVAAPVKFEDVKARS